MSMAWVAVGTAVVGAATSIYSGNQAAKGAGRASALQGRLAAEQSAADNRAIEKQNLDQIVRNSYRTGMMNMQLGLQKKQAVQQGFDASVQFQNIKGQAVSNVEASGAIGASADAVLNDLDMQYNNSKVVQQENFVSLLENYNSELDVMRMNALENVASARKFNRIEDDSQPSRGQIVGTALANAAVSAVGAYAARNMSLGLGPAPASNVQSTTGTMAGFRQDPFGPTQSRFNFGR